MPGRGEIESGLVHKSRLQRRDRGRQRGAVLGQRALDRRVAGQGATDEAAVLLRLRDDLQGQRDQRAGRGFETGGLQVAMRCQQRLPGQP